MSISIYWFIFLFFTIALVHKTCSSKIIKNNLLQSKEKTLIRLQWCWRHRYVGDFMKVTDFRCWWQNHCVDDFFRFVVIFLMYYIGQQQHLKLVTNPFGLQHPSPTSINWLSNVSSAWLIYFQFFPSCWIRLFSLLGHFSESQKSKAIYLLGYITIMCDFSSSWHRGNRFWSSLSVK